MKICEVCGENKEQKTICTIDSYSLCVKHYQRYKRTGKNPHSRSTRDPNEIVIHDDHAEVLLYDKNSNEIARTKISLDKVEIAKQHKWCIYLRDRSSYAITSKEKTTVKMHNILFDVPEGKVVDHINRDSLDNRNENIRFCDNLENSRNIGPKKNNTSGVSGVYWNSDNNKWRSRIKVNYKTIEIGSFDKLEDAKKARKEAEIKYYGEFSPQLSEELNKQ